jgi:foldase protein PrsA
MTKSEKKKKVIAESTVEKEKKHSYLYKSKQLLKGTFSLSTKRGKFLAFGLTALFSMTLGFALANYNMTGATVGGTVVTYDGGYIKGKTLYEYQKNSIEGSNLVKTTLLYETFGAVYGDKISDEEVEAALPNYQNSGLKTIFNNGDTEANLKKLVKQQLALQYGLKDKIEVTDEEISERWTTFHPKMTVQMLVVTDGNRANEISSQLNEGVKFESFLKEDKSGLNGKKATIKSNTEQMAADELKALYETKEGQSVVIAKDGMGADGSPTQVYYVFKLIENPAKGNDMNSWKDEVKELIQEDKVRIGLGDMRGSSDEETMKDINMVKEAIKSVFKERKVRVTDKYMRKALADYLE